MSMLNVPSDSFSHSQVKSKVWLTENLNKWLAKHMVHRPPLDILNWYACWIGLGPLFYLTHSQVSFRELNCVDIDATAIETAQKILNFIYCEKPDFNLIAADINDIKTKSGSDQLFINTSCEHIKGRQWIKNIPQNSLILMQSTNMPHEEHINTSSSLQNFIDSNSNDISVLESAQLDFDYPNMKFSRFMIFGFKK